MSPRTLAQIGDDPVDGWRRGRRKVIDELAAVEQNSLGLRRSR
jgi:hypothetical protein